MADNNNAGIHYIKWKPNYDNTRYYDKKAEELYEKEQQAKLDFENEQILNYELEIEDIKRCGYDMLDVFYSNLAYEAFINEVDLMKAIDNMEAFIEKHGSLEEPLDNALYRMGVLQDIMDIPMSKLTVDRSKEITDYFSNYVIEAIDTDDYVTTKINCLDPNSSVLFEIPMMINSASKLDFYQIDSEYYIDANFGTEYLDISKGKMKSKKCPYRLDINVVRSKNVQLYFAYSKALRESRERGKE